MAQHNDLGQKGEELATDFLLEKGYAIVTTNYRYQKAEIDIIAQKRDTLIAVEVKTRSNTYFGNPQDFIDKKKIALLTTAMDYFVTSNNLEVEVRFDVIAITKQKHVFTINHLKDAFLYF